MIQTAPQHLLLQKRIAIALFGAVLLLFALYVYFLCASILHVVMRTEVDQSVREMRSRISVLEGEFIASQHKVSQDIAHLDGYHRVSDKVFVARTTPSLVLNTQGTAR